MPKRSSGSSYRKSGEIKRLKRQLREMQEQLMNIQSGSDSEPSSSKESLDLSTNELSQEPHIQEGNQAHTPLEPKIAVNEEIPPLPDTALPEQNITGLGIKPDCINIDGPPFHEEIIVRWNS
ncbi:unnamed protein product, partial [Callosobruchus maculatus]